MRFLRFAICALFLAACAPRSTPAPTPTPEVVEVPCGGYTVPDGTYSVHMHILRQALREDGSVLDEDEVEQDYRLTIFRYGCATTLLGVGFHSGPEALEIDVQDSPHPTGNNWRFVNVFSVWGACTVEDGCIVENRQRIEDDGDWKSELRGLWTITDFERWPDYMRRHRAGRAGRDLPLESPSLTDLAFFEGLRGTEFFDDPALWVAPRRDTR